MNIFRPIRTTVTLSLVIALMIQPVAGLGLIADAGDSRICEPAAPSSCGCCELEDAGDSCRCCPTGEQDAVSVDATSAAEGSVMAQAPVEVAGVCLCGRFAPPINRGSERQSISKLIELRKSSLRLVDLLPETDPKTIGGRDDLLSVAAQADHYSQRHLCIWLI